MTEKEKLINIAIGLSDEFDLIWNTPGGHLAFSETSIKRINRKQRELYNWIHENKKEINSKNNGTIGRSNKCQQEKTS